MRMAAGNRGLVGLVLGLTVVMYAGAVALAEPPAPPPPASTDPPEFRLDPIVVTATRLRQPLAEVPAAFSLIESGDIHDGRPALGLDESLTRVPGVFVQNARNFAQDLRLQIRGFGTRSAFGIREIKVLVDGLPETLPDGQTELDSLDVGAAEHIEVLRAPASSLYGNASGGVIQIFTEEAPDLPTVRARVTGGSYGLGKYEIGGGERAGRAGLSVHSSFLHLDGYRDHSAVRRGTFTGKLRYAVDDTTELTFLLNGLDTPRAKDPGGLTRDEVRADPRQARDVSRRLDAGEEVLQGRAGMTLRHRDARGELTAYGYALYRDFEGKLPIVPEAGDGITTLQRLSPGGGLLYQLDARLGGFAERFTLGVDAQHQDDARRRFANLEGDRGARGLEQRERVTSVGPFLRAAWFVRDDLELSAGVRYDRVRFAVDVDVPSDASGSDARTMEAWSPGGGIRWSARPWLSVFANVGTAFQVPTTTELANPLGAGFNADLEPQKATSYEIGGRGTWRDRAGAGLAVFYLDVDDELVIFESVSGRNFFRNAGRSERYGLELDWQVELPWNPRWSSALTLMHASYRDYRTVEGSFDGNEEPGIPSWQVYQELSYHHPHGLYAALALQAVDGFYVDDANTARAHGYELLTLRGGYDGTIAGVSVEPFVTLQNVTDESYSGIVRLNAAGGRFFEPAAGVNVVGGLRVAVTL